MASFPACEGVAKSIKAPNQKGTKSTKKSFSFPFYTLCLCVSLLSRAFCDALLREDDGRRDDSTFCDTLSRVGIQVFDLCLLRLLKAGVNVARMAVLQCMSTIPLAPLNGTAGLT